MVMPVASYAADSEPAIYVVAIQSADDLSLYWDSGLSVQASSEPVSVRDMIEGWEGSVEDGRYAWADARIYSGVTADVNGQRRWTLGWQQRWAYDLEFSEGMARYYYSLEQGDALSQDESLYLQARSIDAEGLFASYVWQPTSQFTVEPTLNLYKVNGWQFGSLSGAAYGGDDSTGDSASVELDYHYDEDKILEYQPDSTDGYGVSIDLELGWQSTDDQWRTTLVVTDLWNLWRTESSGYTDACVNFNSPSEQVCDSSVTVSGRSGSEVFYGRLRPTLNAGIAYAPDQISLKILSHNKYLRAGLQKSFTFGASSSIAVSVWSSRQLGLQASYGWLDVEVLSDDIRAANARDVDVSLNLSVPIW